MATTFPTYPATTFEQAVELSIFASNQLHNVINGDAVTTIETESGDIPSVRKALVDNFFFKTPIKWVSGTTTEVFNQLYYFYEDEVVNGWYYAPSATTDNPVSLGTTPSGDDNWVLYTPISQSVPAQVYPWWVSITENQTSISPPYSFDTAIVTYNGVVLVNDVDYTISDSVITFTHTLEVSNDPDYTDILFCYLGKVEEGDPETNYVTYTNLAKETGASMVGTSSGKSLVESLGTWLDTTTAIFEMTQAPSVIQTRGFYETNDGGAGVWVATGTTKTSLAGTHAITEGKVYNASGVEYLINIKGNLIDPLSNGAKAYTYAEATADTDNFVCLGQAINGIFDQLPIPVETDNTLATETGLAPLSVKLTPGMYRIGKDAIKLYNGTTYDMTGSTLMVYAATSKKFSVTGERLNGMQHGYDEVREKYDAVNGASYWGSVSLRHVTIKGGRFYGDHKPTASAADCSSGVAILILNPEYVNHIDVYARGFMWCAVSMAALVTTSEYATYNKFDVDGVDYKYICEFLGTSRFGNFYGANYENCRFHGGRRGTLRSNVDWSYFKGGTCTNDFHWRGTGNISGDIPDYIMVVTGTGFTCEGAYVSANGGLGATTNPGKAVVYTTAKSHKFAGLYTEWCFCNFMVSRYTYSSGNKMRSMGLSIDCVSQYKNDFEEYGCVQFEAQSFGHYDANSNWVFPPSYSQVNTPQSTHEFNIGIPTRDMGAFLHGGFDFKYGTYNVNATAGDLDFDILRDQKVSKEMFNPYGLMVNKGSLLIPVRNPSKGSHICIWYKDLTGNFDTSKAQLWLTSSIENPVTNNNDFLSRAEHVIDYGNGYKLMMIHSKRWNAFDGVANYGPQMGIYITVDASTPIIIKAVEAYTGGIPFFPSGCDYQPMSAAGSVLGASGYMGPHNGLGGGVFKVGDIIQPWIGVDKHSTDYLYAATLSSSWSTLPKIVASGITLEAAFQVTFSASIISVDSSAYTAVVEIPSTYVSYVGMGIPLYISAGSSTSNNVSRQIISRVANSDGTLTNQYIVYGSVGAAGDTLTIDQSKLSAYTYKSNGSVEATTLTVSGAATAASLTTTGAITSSANVKGATLSISGYATVGNLITNGEVRVGSGGSSGNKILSFYYDGTNVSGRVVAGASALSVNNTFLPTTTATYDLGSSSYTWNNIYTQNAVTVVSDENYKTEIVELSDAELACAKACAKLYRRYKLKSAITLKGKDEARYHIGTIAQLVMQAFTDAGLDWTKYGIITYTSWEASEAVVETVAATYDEEGNELTPENTVEIIPAKEAGEIYMVRYDEFNSFVMAGQEARLQALEDK